MLRKVRASIIRYFQHALKFFGIRAVRVDEYISSKKSLGRLADYRRWSEPMQYPELQRFVIANIEKSHAQLQQDLIAHFLFNEKGRFFVEFGATDGISLSNTYLLERIFEWKGILAEPGKKWLHDLNRNRRSAIDSRAVAGKTGEIRQFKEAIEGEYSTFSDLSDKGRHIENLKYSIEYSVTTVSLNDLLLNHNAPKEIALISIDTEGSELEILNNFDFEQYSVGVFFVEHNHSENKSKIEKIMKDKGYVKFLDEISDFDGWYINGRIIHKLK